jgi:branched-chain amino acid transport system ATP-binding protein
MGLSPLLVKEVFGIIRRLNEELGITILLVEQNANLALEIATTGYVLETGRILLQDDCAALRADPKVRAAYLGG